MRTEPQLRIGTIWKEFYVGFDEFSLAHWLRQDTGLPSQPDLCCVTALGLDFKTSSSALEGTILLDDIRLVAKDGSTVVLDDFEKRDVTQPMTFEGSGLRWKTGAQTLR